MLKVVSIHISQCFVQWLLSLQPIAGSKSQVTALDSKHLPAIWMFAAPESLVCGCYRVYAQGLFALMAFFMLHAHSEQGCTSELLCHASPQVDLQNAI